MGASPARAVRCRAMLEAVGFILKAGKEFILRLSVFQDASSFLAGG